MSIQAFLAMHSGHTVDEHRKARESELPGSYRRLDPAGHLAAKAVIMAAPAAVARPPAGNARLVDFFGAVALQRSPPLDQKASTPWHFFRSRAAVC